ncbi:hypothetical protein GLOTRDRAFT_135670 [Gloeophyllum trabeum ATCC 11539]|uniref:SprT-like domain-containing protein n=1 Tax=Gloeophyllum trabeum (strain ATCC 11539 / FP-39264 / Madison 617) TaxID=670483 RepID=S7QP79_GLOTA|nr:uncharacterized protein GLOTRDRAFT_135670 [Gloeophyllum trabeum ATCC 11539]EPQ61122.1 hypothetical protein GLOTRDRAFT_135670 [Gloeophyllum trabeum ATCC 11539]
MKEVAQGDDTQARGLRREPSLRDMDLNTPSKARNHLKPGNVTPSARARAVRTRDSSNEVIPDSEEERMNTGTREGGEDLSTKTKKVLEIIEISSDSEDEQPRRPTRAKLGGLGTKQPTAPAATTTTGTTARGSPSVSAVRPRNMDFISTPGQFGSSKQRDIPRDDSQVTVHSSTTTHVSDSQEGSILKASADEPNIIELTDSDPEPVDLRPKPKPRSKNKAVLPPAPDEPVSSASRMLPLYADEEPREVDDGSILMLNEPRAARTPLRKKKAPGASTPAVPSSVSTRRAPTTPRRAVSAVDSDSEDVESLPASGMLPQTPSRAGSSRTPRQPRMTKKAREAAEHAERAAYAEKLFIELNRTIFKDRLPADTELVWNPRLLTTAGKARWHKSSDGTKSASIELARKILDCEERIRFTLAHEMCHLACWIIDHDPTTGHGKNFNAWACKVMRKRPDIEISTRHNYEISYKYEWQCQKCSKIYGRFSKSINPEECVCGACREGRLEPLFTTRKRARKTPQTSVASPLAAERGRDSPYSLARLHIPGEYLPTPTHSTTYTGDGFTLESDFLDSDIEDMTRAMDAVEIGLVL